MYRVTIQSFDHGPKTFEGSREEIKRRLSEYFGIVTVVKKEPVEPPFEISAPVPKPIAYSGAKRMLIASGLWNQSAPRLSAQQIASVMGISFKTVKRYISEDRRKNKARLFPHRRPAAIEGARARMLALRARIGTK